jgi:hypothetical protein
MFLYRKLSSLFMAFDKIKQFFKKNVKVEVIDDSIKLKRKDIKNFLNENLDDKMSEVNNTVEISYQYLSKCIEDLNIDLTNKTSKYAKKLTLLLNEIKIPKRVAYFDAHVFVCENLKKLNSFMYETRDDKEKQNYSTKLLYLREIFLTTKKIIDNSNLMFYDVLLEEIENQESLISRELLEFQIFKLVKKKVTIVD